MKKVGALLIVMILLTGCSRGDPGMERALALRGKLLRASGCSFDTKITADYGDKLYEFSLDCEADAQGNLTFSVLQPESIAGITGNIRDSGGNLTFEDVALHFDLMAEDQLSPVSAPWIFLKTLRSGYITSTAEEEGSLRLSVDDSFDDDALRLDIWLGEDSLPYRAEILHDGRRILSLSITNFALL